jgi:hypothetical protein
MQRLEVSGAVRRLYGSLGVKGLIYLFMLFRSEPTDIPECYNGIRSGNTVKILERHCVSLDTCCIAKGAHSKRVCLNVKRIGQRGIVS